MKQRDLDMSNLHQDFLCEMTSLVSGEWRLIRASDIKRYASVNHKFRPAMRIKQVLDDYKSTLIDGLMWDCSYTHIGDEVPRCRTMDYVAMKEITIFIPERIHFIEFLGVAPNCGLDEWADRHDVPIITRES